MPRNLRSQAPAAGGTSLAETSLSRSISDLPSGSEIRYTSAVSMSLAGW